MKQRPWATK